MPGTVTLTAVLAGKVGGCVTLGATRAYIIITATATIMIQFNEMGKFIIDFALGNSLSMQRENIFLYHWYQSN